MMRYLFKILDLIQSQFDFADSIGYKEKLSEIRIKQKELIKNKIAVSGNTNWQVNGSAFKRQEDGFRHTKTLAPCI